MNHFAQGILKAEEDGYIGEPDLLLANGQTIRLLYADLRRGDELEEEEEDPVSALLEADDYYELLLIVQLGLGNHHIVYKEEVPDNTVLEIKPFVYESEGETHYTSKITQGIILDLKWDAASIPYLAVGGQKVFTHHFVLLETAIGKVVASYPALQKALGEQVQHLAVGGYLEWTPARLDILAIIDRKPPSSIS
jgi:hypothetical protein